METIKVPSKRRPAHQMSDRRLQKYHTRMEEDSAEEDGRNLYDSDLSIEDSIRSWTDSDDSFGPPSRPPSPSLLSHIPRGVALKPSLPRSFVWRCPEENCLHKVDMLNLRQEDVACLPAEFARVITNGGWQISDERVQVSFNTMVDEHLRWHLDQAGIEFYDDGKGRVSICFATSYNPAHHDMNL